MRPALDWLKTQGTDVQRDFANGAFREGDPVERLLQRHPPQTVIHYPEYQTLQYECDRDPSEQGFHVLEFKVIARDGRLVAATVRLEIGPRSTYSHRFFGADVESWLFFGGRFAVAGVPGAFASIMRDR
jgi:hypothetical protein